MLPDLLVYGERVRDDTSKGRTSVDDGVGTFTDFLVFDPVVRPRRSRWHTSTSR